MMKFINLILLSLFILICEMNYAGEVTGAGGAVMNILKVNGFTNERMNSEGLELKLGEVTGAGFRVNIDRVKYILAKKKLYPMAITSHIEFVEPGQARTFNEINTLEFDQFSIQRAEVIGLLIEK